MSVTITNATQGGNSVSEDPNLSADGTTVAFHSIASNLVAGDTNGRQDVFVKDLETGEITNVTQGAEGESSRPSLSADSTTVAFTSYAANLVAGDTNGTYDVFVATLSAPSPNRAPEVQANKTLTVLEDAAATALAITAPTDPDGDGLTITVNALPTKQGHGLPGRRYYGHHGEPDADHEPAHGPRVQAGRRCR
jgi:hypothetical protein